MLTTMWSLTPMLMAMTVNEMMAKFFSHSKCTREKLIKTFRLIFVSDERYDDDEHALNNYKAFGDVERQDVLDYK